MKYLFIFRWKEEQAIRYTSLRERSRLGHVTVWDVVKGMNIGQRIESES